MKASDPMFWVENLTPASVSRLYFDGAEDTAGVVTVRMVLRHLNPNQLPGAPTTIQLALSVHAAERLALSLEQAAQRLRQQAATGDH